MQDNQKFEEKKKQDRMDRMAHFWEGSTNKLVRWWTYIKRGMGVVNEFKYFLGVFIGTYIATYIEYIKPFVLDHPFVLPPVAVIGIFVLGLIGRWELHRVSPTTEYVNTIFGTVLGYGPWENQQETLATLKEILNELKK